MVRNTTIAVDPSANQRAAGLEVSVPAVSAWTVVKPKMPKLVRCTACQNLRGR